MNKETEETEAKETMISQWKLLIVIREIMKKYPVSNENYILFRWQALVNYIMEAE